MKNFKLRNLVLAGMIAALYAGITFAFGELSYWGGLFQIRPAEALTVLPLLFAEAIPGLFVGCMLANIISQFGIFDIILGSLITLIAAILTKYSKKIGFGIIPPIILNALLLPLIFMLAGGTDAYLVVFVSILITQTIWVAGLGIPLYFSAKKLKPYIYKNFETNRKNVDQKNTNTNDE